MMAAGIATLAWRNVIHGRTRSLLTILSVAVGISSVTLISALGATGERTVVDEIDRLGVGGYSIYATSDAVSLDASDAESVSAEDGISAALPVVSRYGSFRFCAKSGSALIWGVNEQFDRVMGIELLHGRLPTASDLSTTNLVAVIDSELAERCYHRTNVVGRTIELTIGKTSRVFVIIGVISAQKSGLNQLVGGAIPDFIYIPYTVSVEMSHDTEADMILIKIDDSANSDAVVANAVRRLERRFSVSDGAFDVTDMSGYVDSLKSVASAVREVLSAIAAISLIVAGIGIMNVMLSGAAERKREIGVSMAVGARRKDIALCFLCEAMFLSVIGCVFGNLFGYFSAEIAAKAVGMGVCFDLKMTVEIMAVCVLFGLIFGVIPAIKAAKLNPIAALREN